MDAIPGGIGANSALNFLPKPFNLADLAGKVKELIASCWVDNRSEQAH